MKQFLRESDSYQHILSQIPNGILRMACVANADINFGPLNPDFIREEQGRNYPDWDFSKGLERLYDWASSFDFPEYLDEDGFAISLEGKEELEENDFSYYSVTQKDWCEALFGNCWSYVSI